jgi:hypothetical protein
MVCCQIIGKGVYKQMSRSAVHDVEKQKLTTHCIYYVIKNHMLMRKQLLNIIKLIAFPEISDDFTCNGCNIVYSDAVSHYIIHCEMLISGIIKSWTT